MKRILMLAAAAALAACATTDTVTDPTYKEVAPTENITASEAAQNEDASSLRNLTSIMIDTQRIYEGAVDMDIDQPLKDEMAELARQRGEIIAAFQARLEGMDERQAPGGELLGGWHEMKQSLSAAFDNDTDAALDTAVAREENLLSEAMQALEGSEAEDLSEGTLEFIKFHVEKPQGIRAGHDHVNVLRARYEEK